MKEKFKRAYMQTAQTFAELSSARRLKVGAIVVKDDRIISIGYNGMPAGWDNDCETEVITEYDNAYDTNNNPTSLKTITLVTKPEVLHAEANAITKLAKSNDSGEGSTLFVTHAPCLHCAKLIYQSGIKRVIYSQQYRDDSGIKFLEKSSVTIEQLQTED
jgi:dCMP deaminase